MYIFISILASLCLGFMIYIDHVILNKASFKFILLFKAIALMLFAVLFMATKQTFDKLLDFNGLEWLYFAIIVISGLVIYFFYHLSVKNVKPHRFALFNIPSILIFINIFFLIFSMNTVVKDKDLINLILVIVELVISLVVILTSILTDKETKKINILYMILPPLALGGSQLLLSYKDASNKTLFRPGLEVFFFWSAVLILIFSIFFFVCYKEKNAKTEEKQVNLSKKERGIAKKKEEKLAWQTLLIIASSCALFIVGFSMAYGAKHNYKTESIFAVINFIIGLGFLVPNGIHIFQEIRNNKNIKVVLENNFVILANCILVIISSILYMMASII